MVGGLSALKISDALGCVANVSVRFRSKERGTRVKDRAKNGVSERAGRGWGRKEGNFLPLPILPLSFFGSCFISRAAKTQESRSSVFLCYETKRKRLLRRLQMLQLKPLFTLISSLARTRPIPYLSKLNRLKNAFICNRQKSVSSCHEENNFEFVLTI